MAHTTLHHPAALEHSAADEKWTARRTLVFAVVASLGLWGLIFLGISALI